MQTSVSYICFVQLEHFMTTHQSSGISYPDNNRYDNCNDYMNSNNNNNNDKTTTNNENNQNEENKKQQQTTKEKTNKKDKTTKMTNMRETKPRKQQK